ncbi:MAG: aminotransferase class V-fold PLP-dependent enzyme [Amphritea sp.]|nr:aminotransferase class V-fold PLP-dependent enzyme [Amphritea sp.]
MKTKSASSFSDALVNQIRERFFYVDECPFEGPRIFFENAGGSLTLKSVIQQTTAIACIPDNGGRNNLASQAMEDICVQGKKDLATLLGASTGVVFGGETGTECLFRAVRTAALESEEGGSIVACSVEHPATFNSTEIWARKTGREWIAVPFDVSTGVVTADHYAEYVRPDTRIATIIHTNPVTGMVMDVKAIAERIRSISPDCYIIVDGIQHAPHGFIGIDELDVDAYVISLYKVFSKFNNGYAWLSDRFSVLPHDKLLGNPAQSWELGSRDPSAYAAVSAVLGYFEWLGSNFTNSESAKDKLIAAGDAMHVHERCLIDFILHGDDQAKGLLSYDSVRIVGDVFSDNHESVVTFHVDGRDAKDIVVALADHNIRIHARSDDAYSGNILRPLGFESVARVSLGHYNTLGEVRKLLEAINEIFSD